MASAKKLVEMGFEHHVAMCYGDVADETAMLAELWGIDLVRLWCRGESTTELETGEKP